MKHTRRQIGKSKNWVVMFGDEFIGVIGFNSDTGEYDVLDWKDFSNSSYKTITGCINWLNRNSIVG